MWKVICFTILFMVYLSGSFAQVSDNQITEHLFSYGHSISVISRDNNKYVLPAEPNFANLPQYLIKNSKGLYLALNGSGRLYKASLKNDKVIFGRIDSTVYFGSNFGSFFFSYRDTIYSLGGYGFWKTNGLLRYYVEQRHEWEIIKLNKEIPFFTGNDFDLIWYDQANGKLYLGFTKEAPGTTTDKESKNNIRFETQVLDLVKKEWQQVGILSSFLKNDLTSISNITSSPFGQMIAFRNKNLFLDYANNRVYRLSDTKQKEVEQLPTSTGDLHVTYFIDSTFYSWLTAKNLVDSLKINPDDLVLLDEKIYLPGQSPITIAEKKQTPGSVTTFSLLAGLAILVAIILLVIRKKKAVSPNLKSNHTIEHNIFTEPEIEVLKTIAGNSQKAMLTSIDEINKVLGVNKKSIEIQKKQRSDVIANINKKYSYIQKDKGELIERKQAEFDKRSFEYFIDYSKLGQITTFITSNGNN